MRSILLAACAALVIVALPAAAMAEPRGLAVSASLAGCEDSGARTVCEIEVSFETIDGADSYTARVTAPSGDAEDFGQVSGGSASLPVAYAGNGRYVVTITAFQSGSADSKTRLARDSSR